MLEFLTIGILLGISAGFAPGPLLTLVISETLQHDIKSGIKVALAPVITDLPIIIFTVFILSALSNFHFILGIISLAGGFFILYMSYENIISEGCDLKLQKSTPKSFTKGVLANVLSPHPYLFWLSVGAPIITRAMSINTMAAVLFIISFYTCLVTSKILLAILTGKSKSFLCGKTYRHIMHFLGLILAILSFALFFDGLKLLGIIKTADSLL